MEGEWEWTIASASRGSRAVLAALLAEQESVCVTLEGLRAQGKTRTATYQQLTARKLALKSMLGAFEEQGLL